MVKVRAHHNDASHQIGSSACDEQRHDPAVAVTNEMRPAPNVLKKRDGFIGHGLVMKILIGVGGLSVTSTIERRYSKLPFEYRTDRAQETRTAAEAPVQEHHRRCTLVRYEAPRPMTVELHVCHRPNLMEWSRETYSFGMRAFVINETDDHFERGVLDVDPRATTPDDVLVRVDFSGVNFKDALVASSGSRVRRSPRLVGGVDAAGVVEESSDPSLPTGTRVAVHGGDLGVARDGGFAQYVWSAPRYVNALPDSISTRSAMVIGTAGFTAMQSVLALEDHGLHLGGDVLVTGATGGVGSMAVALLSARGYQVVASTGSIDEADWLLALGASRVIGRDDISDRPERVLASERWDGAVDCIGGASLAHILRSLRYGASVAASGLVGGTDLATTVYPFITRGVSLLGIDSAEAPVALRERVWMALGEAGASIDWSSLIDREVSLEDLGAALDRIHDGLTRGRIIVDPTAV